MLYFYWFLRCAGLLGLLELGLVLAMFVGACVVVARSPRPRAIARYMAFVPLPLLFGVAGRLHGFLSAYSALATVRSPVANGWLLAAGITEAILPTPGELMMLVPTSLVIAVGLYRRARAMNKPPGRRQ
ncbi:MAG: hypothetical protein ACLQLG_01410 [Thermoguttaceae bacterium]